MGDYDNDGDLDLYVTNGSQANKLFRNDGGGAWSDATAGPLGDTREGTGLAWGDADNDGDLDLYLVNWTTSNVMFRNDGGTFVDATVSPLDNGGPGKGAAWCDVDDDGDLDLYLANSGQSNKLFRNDTSGNRWLHVELTGTASNRSAIGARVIAVTPGLRQVREVSGGAGIGSQGSLAVEFGLGSSASVDSLVVRWPSGTVQVLTGVAADQRLPLTEPTATAAPTAPGIAGRSRPAGADPNPFQAATAIRYELAVHSVVALGIFDVQGRCVRRLDSGAEGPGPHEAVWDGRDDAGRLLPGGVYFYRLEVGGLSHAGKIVRIR
jgi:hypothetical protein